MATTSKCDTQPEYIIKETLQEKLNRKKAGPADKRYTEGWNDAILMVKSMIHSEKAADVVPVRHGEWIVCGDGDNVPWMCSHCGKTTAHKYKVVYGKYCPNCGAKMDI